MKAPKPDIYYNVPEAEYRAWKATNISSLLYLKQSPAHYQVNLEYGTHVTGPMFQGSAIHCLVLYGREQYITDYLGDGDTEPTYKPPKGTLKAWKEIVEGQYAMLQSDPQSRSFRGLIQGQPEVCVVAVDPTTGILLKGRVDRYIAKENRKRIMIIDLKKCQDCRDVDSFRKTIEDKKYRYDIKASFYRHLVEIVTGKETSFAWVAVETARPYACNFFSQSIKSYTNGMVEVNDMLATLKKCQDSGVWLGYKEKGKAIVPSRWILNDKIDPYTGEIKDE